MFPTQNVAGFQPPANAATGRDTQYRDVEHRNLSDQLDSDRHVSDVEEQKSPCLSKEPHIATEFGKCLQLLVLLFACLVVCLPVPAVTFEACLAA